MLRRKSVPQGIRLTDGDAEAALIAIGGQHMCHGLQIVGTDRHTVPALVAVGIVTLDTQQPSLGECRIDSPAGADIPAPPAPGQNQFEKQDAEDQQDPGARK